MDSKHSTARALRAWVTAKGIRPVARDLGLSTETVARYAANMRVQRATAALIEQRLHERAISASNPTNPSE